MESQIRYYFVNHNKEVYMAKGKKDLMDDDLYIR
jgi:hypothetical protein